MHTHTRAHTHTLITAGPLLWSETPNLSLVHPFASSLSLARSRRLHGNLPTNQSEANEGWTRYIHCVRLLLSIFAKSITPCFFYLFSSFSQEYKPSYSYGDSISTAELGLSCVCQLLATAESVEPLCRLEIWGGPSDKVANRPPQSAHRGNFFSRRGTRVASYYWETEI